MIRYLGYKLLSLALVLVVGLAATSKCQAWSLASQPVDGILLLRNGNLLSGKLQLQGDRYYVYLPNGKLQVRAEQVETVCQNIEAAYQHRRKKRGGSSADSHLDLAGGCLRHDLFEHAEQELTEAKATDPDHPRLPLLERQLKQSVQLAQLANEKQLAAKTPVPEPAPLDQAMLDKAPRWARALFVRQIQPLVVHSCGTGGCHQPGTDSKFQLDRLALDGAGHPGVTLRNLAATLEQINWQAADQSSLLQRAKLAHGSESGSSPLPPHKLKVLEGWIGQLAEAHRQDTELRTLPMLAEVDEPEVTPTLQLVPPQQTVTQPAAPSPQSGIRTASFERADPFDPSVFNDRYATAKKPTALTSSDLPPTIETPVPAAETSSVPHVLAPSDPALIPLPATE